MPSEELFEKIDQYENKIIEWRRTLHQFPELGLELPQTVAYVRSQLVEMGLSVQDHYVNGNGLAVVIEGTREGSPCDRVMGLRTDMDGLPIQEETGLPFASKNGNMHACGHDGHTANLLGVAWYLSQNTHLFRGKVKLIFQPGEEYPGGAEPMIQEGVLKDPDVTRVLGFHIGHLDKEIPPGHISYRVGPMMASMDRFRITIKGSGFHAGYPESSKDPIPVAAELITAFQTIKSRNIKASEPVVISVTHIEGGFNQNIIPDQVFIEGTVRTLNDTMRSFIHGRMEKIIQGLEVAYDVQISFSYDYKYPVLINDEVATKETVQALKAGLGSGLIMASKDALMGAEDFAYYGKEVPASFLFLANPRSIDGHFHGHHSSKFDIDESKLILAFKAFILATLDYLQ
ncbi:M20 metallopeptidase family protein [Facklamia miroungae]|uniref:Amidohydrolase n=1 Tax=Facklamia miroungae TaxID=120956 RepID=A0A1G7PJ25_9LACT|nr:amidohydrolase [Facklamia miroungae]NKZ28705.1 amidohydrolase [Facklamia miroungae]SDF85400.1 amidohydrolase [Facklamia miroungae]